MIAPEEEVVIDVNTSCTKDEAVAKLLGWSKGPIFPRRIQVTEYGVERVDLGKLSTFETGVQGQLEQIHISAQNRLLDAAEGDWTPAKLESLENEVYKCRELIQQAAEFFLDIDDELARGPDSDLRIDREATEKTGNTHITLRSLAAWAFSLYGITILPNRRPNSANVIAGKSVASDVAENFIERPDQKYPALLITFSFLIDALLDRTHQQFKHGEKLNRTALATELSRIATLANRGERLSGQSVEGIKDRIEAALRTRQDALPKK